MASSPIYDSLQSACRSGYSTEMALLKVMDDIYCHIDSGSTVALVGLDILAAFDAVNHKTLMDRLHFILFVREIRLCSHEKFIIAYSCNELRCPARVSLGAYLVYVAPSVDSSATGIGYHKYANDTQFYSALLASLPTDLNQLKMCSSALQLGFWRIDLLLNSDKSEVAFFGTNHTPFIVPHRQYGTAYHMTVELHHLSLSFESGSKCTI